MAADRAAKAQHRVGVIQGTDIFHPGIKLEDVERSDSCKANVEGEKFGDIVTGKSSDGDPTIRLIEIRDFVFGSSPHLDFSR